MSEYRVCRLLPYAQHLVRLAVCDVLEQEGCLESYWDASAGRKKKYYHITKKGRKLLESKKAEFTAFSDTVQKVLSFA